MAQVAGIPPSPEEVAALKKRARKPPPLKGPGVVVLPGERFVCSYTGRVVSHAIVPNYLHGVAFANLPACKAWIAMHGRSDEEKHELWADVCEQYQQDPEQVPNLPPLHTFADFGGELPYEDWIAGLEFWDVHAKTMGVDAPSFKQRTGKLKKKKSAKKAKKVEPVKFQFVRGVYSINHKTDTIKSIQEVQSLGHEEGKKGDFTALDAMARVRTFQERHAKMEPAVNLRFVTFNKPFGLVTGLVYASEFEPRDESLANRIAQRMDAELDLVGPCVLHSMKKATLKFE